MGNISVTAMTSGRPGKWWALSAAVFGVAALVAYLLIAGDKGPARADTAPATPSNTAALPAPAYVGGQACASCHAKQHGAWSGSHHDLAMQAANDRSVLGNFANASFRYAGVTSTFFKRDGKFYVNTDGADGKLADHEIRYSFGVTPLQQYLIELPGGRLQAFGIAWDARPKNKGGQRWFHLYPDRKLKAGDPLHWTGIDQNWNYQCADCHSTNLKKNYDANSRRFDTKWSEINVSCEACHGPGSNHLAWAKKEGDWQQFGGPGKGLPEILDERRDAIWIIDPKTGNAARSNPRAGVREIETCARCHARRGQFSDDFVHGQPLAASYRAALLDEGLYWNDGQQRDEVYNYASFLQSKMFARGVTCSDCHEPHSLKLRAAGNAVCAQCHLASKYDSPRHSFHAAGSKGGECAACHMPTTTYMVIDSRHDHSMRIPRPDLSVQLGVPNACNRCHADKKPEWAAAQVKKWYGHTPAGYQRFAGAFHAGGTDQGLRDVARDADQPAIARASALSRLGPPRDRATLAILRQSLSDPDGMVRLAAVGAFTQTDPALRLQVLPPLLADPVRGVRMEAARALAGAPEQQLPAADRASFSAALAEYVAAQRFNADRPESQTNLAMLLAERGDTTGALKALQEALALDPSFTPAVVNMADLYRALGRETEAEKLLRAALVRAPGEASLHHALGLALVRQQRTGEAVAELAKSARLAPDNARYAYVHAIALHGSGKIPAAIAALERMHQRFPGNPEVLSALAAFERDRGNQTAAMQWARKLDALQRQ